LIQGKDQRGSCEDMNKAALTAQEKANAQRAIEAAFDRIKLK
jgi:hypothetical protein